MIPKIIHYCWFGNELPDKFKIYLYSWIEHLWTKGYTIKYWTLDNIKEFIDSSNAHYMIEHKLWAFLSDYIRCKVLYKYGGIYLDSDIILCDNFDKICNLDTYLGLERCTNIDFPKLNNHLICFAIMGSFPRNHLFLKAINLINHLDKKYLYGSERVLAGGVFTNYILDNVKYKIVDSIEEAASCEKSGILPLFNAPTFDSFPSKLEQHDYDICDHFYHNTWVDYEVKQKNI